MMKNKKLHTIILPLCTLLLFSCTQDNISPASDTENEIRFQTGTTTRGLIDNLAQEGTKITLYGYHGTDVLAKDKKPLAGKSLTYTSEGRWVVVDDDSDEPTKPITYFWEGNGNYRFFGWLKKDANGLTATRLTTNYADNKLTVSGTLNDQYDQFDFLYSNVDQRTLTDANMANEKGRPVAMNMNHLFSAFSIGIKNLSAKKITVKSIVLQRIKTQGSATINYSDTEQGNGKESIELGLEQTFISYTNDVGYEVDAAGGLKHNIFNPDATEKMYYLTWPQDLPELIFKTENDEEKAENAVFPLLMTYMVEGDSKPITKRMKLPHTIWLAGKKYSYEVMIADKYVDLLYSVSDWDYVESDVDFREGTVTVTDETKLDWENGETNADGTVEKNTCEVDVANKKVYVLNGQAVEATFGFVTPRGGQWKASLKGDVDAFTLIDGQGPIDNNLHRIKIQPTIINPRQDYSVRLEFVVIAADGKTYPADVVQNTAHGEIYSIVLLKP